MTPFLSVCSGIVVWWLVRRRAGALSAISASALSVIAAWTVLAWWQGDTSPLPENLPIDPTVIRSSELAQLHPVRPIAENGDGFVSSGTCRECHPHNHATWAASYHRKMTQVATPEAVIGDFDDVEVTAQGRRYRLSRRRDVCWVVMDDPEAPVGAERIEVPIVLTTGSHHMQVYWYATGRSRTVGQLPIAFLMETGKWVPRDALFLSAPAPFGSETGRWNRTCIACHATHGQPRPNPDGDWDSRVAEFGIACEACHGPAEQHVEMHRAGLLPPGTEDPIVNPESLPHDRASEVCGQCHSINSPLDTPSFVKAQIEGASFRPGQELSASRLLVRENKESRDHLQRYIGDEVEQYMLDQYWPDGMVRISGREFNGLTESACFQKGELSCLTCHVLHPDEDDTRPLLEWANDQLRAEMSGDAACLSCHESERYDSRHTHHSVASTGSRCANCHMPHTTYGLLKAIRSHEITIPSVAADDVAAGRPNACNLCHLDRTAEWSAQQLNSWFGEELPKLTEDQKQIASSLLWMLRGDAGQRAISAWSMGWKPALDASGSDWQAPFLATLLDDPYDAVRFIAQRSLRSLPGFETLSYDYVGPVADRAQVRQQVIQQWDRHRQSDGRRRPELLIDLNNRLQGDVLFRLLQQRDDRPVNLAE
jgi:hypothetical protein